MTIIGRWHWPALTRREWLYTALVWASVAVYLILAFTAPRQPSSNNSNIPMAVILIMAISLLVLLLGSWVLGVRASLQLDRYANHFPGDGRQQGFTQIARGIRWLVLGLVVSMFINVTSPFYRDQPGLTAITSQVNFYIIIGFPLAGFALLWQGARRLALFAQVPMLIKNKLVIAGLPIALLASFYITLSLTNNSPQTQILLSGLTGMFLLPIIIVIVLGSWTFGLLAALHIERFIHHGDIATQARPLSMLYNGILMITCGFIILDGLLSIGADRISSLPVSLTIILVYLFIGVITIGFMLISHGAKQLIMAAEKGR